ncbi:MAG: hypothetical protein IJQ80_02735 [Clostridia bacterium]|nr:hypothetical protein [Clostridia bacterium]
MFNAILIAAALLHICIAVSHFFITSKIWARRARIFSLIAGIAGFAGAVICSAEFYIRISRSGFAPDLAQWCRDVFSGCLCDVLPVFGVIFVLLTASSVFQPKMLPLRSALGALSAIFLLIYSKITVALSDNSLATVKWEILTLCVSLSLALLICRIADFRRLENKTPDEKRKNKRVRVIKK